MAFESFKKALFPDKSGDEIEEIEEETYEVEEKKGRGAKGADPTGNKMILVEPRAYSESTQIADHLKRRNAVVVNLKRVTNDQAKRIIDFLSGTLYAIGGDLQKLGNGIYLCTPKNVNVEGRMSDEESDKKAKSKVEDEMDF